MFLLDFGSAVSVLPFFALIWSCFPLPLFLYFFLLMCSIPSIRPTKKRRESLLRDHRGENPPKLPSNKKTSPRPAKNQGHHRAPTQLLMQYSPPHRRNSRISSPSPAFHSGCVGSSAKISRGRRPLIISSASLASLASSQSTISSLLSECSSFFLKTSRSGRPCRRAGVASGVIFLRV